MKIPVFWDLMLCDLVDVTDIWWELLPGVNNCEGKFPPKKMLNIYQTMCIIVQKAEIFMVIWRP
jgi:hypothetical protein